MIAVYESEAIESLCVCDRMMYIVTAATVANSNAYTYPVMSTIGCVPDYIRILNEDPSVRCIRNCRIVGLMIDLQPVRSGIVCMYIRVYVYGSTKKNKKKT